MDSQDWVEILRKAADDDERTQAELARESGLSKAQISRFLSGKRELMIRPAARLAAVLGLRIVRSV